MSILVKADDNHVTSRTRLRGSQSGERYFLTNGTTFVTVIAIAVDYHKGEDS